MEYLSPMMLQSVMTAMSSVLYGSTPEGVLKSTASTTKGLTGLYTLTFGVLIASAKQSMPAHMSRPKTMKTPITFAEVFWKLKIRATQD